MSSRKSNWPALLALFIEEKQHAPFEWGQNDCCMFTADWICILTGEYPHKAAEMRGTYSTAAEAAEILKACGGVETIWAEAAEKYGWKPCPTSLAQRGDIATVDTEHAGPSMGVVIGATVLYAGTDGAVEIPTNKCRKAWRIG